MGFYGSKGGPIEKQNPTIYGQNFVNKSQMNGNFLQMHRFTFSQYNQMDNQTDNLDARLDGITTDRSQMSVAVPRSKLGDKGPSNTGRPRQAQLAPLTKRSAKTQMERMVTEESRANIKVATPTEVHLGNYLVPTKRKIVHVRFPEAADSMASNQNTKRPSDSIAYAMVHR